MPEKAIPQVAIVRSALYSSLKFLGKENMKVSELEQRVWELEGLRIVVRANRNDEVEDYDYKNAANENWRTAEFVKNRVERRVGGREVTVIQGDGKIANGNLLLYALRKSYSSK